MIMCRKYALLLIFTSTLDERRGGGGGSGRFAQVCIPEAEVSNVTWEESVTHSTSGAYALL